MERIAELVKKAEASAMEKLSMANELIADIKQQMIHGTDCITTPQIQEWAIAIPIIYQELTPTKEAFALTKDLWDIEIKRMAAKNLLELTAKKTEIEQINRLSATENEERKAISDYMRNMLGGTQKALEALGNSLRKILSARVLEREVK